MSKKMSKIDEKIKGSSVINPLKNVKILEKRCCGNSTRILDEIIHLLFSNNQNEVLIVDHVDDGLNRRQNDILVKKLKDRIDSEHKPIYVEYNSFNISGFVTVKAPLI